jgi:hypothetical protein
VGPVELIGHLLTITYQNFHQGFCFCMPAATLTAGVSVGSLTVGAAVAFGGRLIPTYPFGRGGPSSPLKSVAIVGPRGGRGGEPFENGNGTGVSVAFTDISFAPAAVVPEPASFGLYGLGLAAGSALLPIPLRRKA